MRKANRRRQYTNYKDHGRRRSRVSITSRASLCILSMIHPGHALPGELRTETVTDRTLQGNGLTVGTSVDLPSCYIKLNAADANFDSKLSPDEFLSFAQASADGLLNTTQWGTPITKFYQLPSEFIGLYNLFACGDANYGCPSVVGIDIDGVAPGSQGDGEMLSAQQQTLLFQLCKITARAAENLRTSAPIIPPRTDAPTVSPAFDVATTGAPTNSPASVTTAAPTRSPSAPPISGAPTNSPAYATAAPTNSRAPSAPPTTSGPPPCPPLYDVEASYGAGDLVSLGGVYYQCRSGQQSGWCDQAAYAPGNTLVDWSQAWNLMGECVDGSEAKTTSPEELYHGEWWADLPPEIQDAYAVLGFNETLWNGGHTTDYDDKLWEELTMEQREAAAIIGYTEELWCASEAPAASSAPSATPEYASPTSPPTHSPVANDTTSPPSPKPTPAPVATVRPTLKSPDEDLYTGSLSTEFQYEIYNSLNLDAEGVRADNETMRVLLETTAEFVELVVDDTFAPSVGVGVPSAGVDQAEFNNKGGGRERRGLRKQHRRADPATPGVRGVILHPEMNSVTINNIEDVACSGPSPTPVNTTSDENLCQKVTAGALLVLVSEPKNAIALRFQMAVGRSLEDPGMTFPPESGVNYAGPAMATSIGVFPEATRPVSAPVEGPPAPAPEEGDTPKWVVPVSILAAALGASVLVLFAGSRVLKRRRGTIEYGSHDSKAKDDLRSGGSADGGSGGGNSAEQSASFNDMQSSDRSSKSDFGDTNPFFHVDGDGGPQAGRGGEPNPFLNSQSSASSGMSYSSYSQSISSDSSSTSEDIGVVPEEFWKGTGEDTLTEDPDKRREDSWQLGTLHEVSETDLSSSAWSMSSGGAKSSSDRSVYRAGVEALVKEACPEEYYRIDEMMVEYEGREEVLIGNLSTMLTAKNSSSGSDTSDSDEGPQVSQRSLMSELTFETKSSLAMHGSNRSTFSTLSTAEEDRVKRTSPKNDQASMLESAGADAAVLEAGGSASAAVVANLFAPNSSFMREDDDLSSSSDAGSSDWSSDDGLSSIDASSSATSSATEGTPKPGRRASGYLGKPAPTFLAVDGPAGGAGEGRAPEPSGATKGNLEDAIQAGDWKAVGATAALISDPSTKVRASPGVEDFNESASSFTSHEKRKVNELEQLVEAGDWRAVMAATSQFDGDSDTEGSSMLSELRRSGYSSDAPMTDATEDLGNKNRPSLDSNNNPSEIIAEIEELVGTVVPDELGNIDEMLIQFVGREEELLWKLRHMKDEGMGPEEASSTLETSHGSRMSVYEQDTSSKSGLSRSSMELSAGDSSYAHSEDGARSD